MGHVEHLTDSLPARKMETAQKDSQESFSKRYRQIKMDFHYTEERDQEMVASPPKRSYVANGEEIVIDNQWVLPYSPQQCKIFDAHINVELINVEEVLGKKALS